MENHVGFAPQTAEFQDGDDVMFQRHDSDVLPQESVYTTSTATDNGFFFTQSETNSLYTNW